ncbi:MAG: FAD-dependent oxidoreductase, partial [Clostridiales bacterium]|nr:FAD-dependent oxidoreductase [Clostridiales bacterium]
ESVRQIETILRVLRESVPGFAKAALMEYAPSLGIRQSRILRGRTVFDGAHVLEATRFPDAVCMLYGYGVPNHEQHSPDGMEGSKEHPQGEGDPGSGHPIGVYPYFLPLGMLCPPEVDGLLVAGRCASTTHLGNVWFRGMPSCMLTGQVAGVAAALSAATKTAVPMLPLEQIRGMAALQGLNSSMGEAPAPAYYR